LRLIAAAPAPRTTVQSPLEWNADPDWKLDYCNIARLSPEETAKRRTEFDRQKDVARTRREN
jgi:D-proline reductase (dithiol) PrdB